MNDHYPNSGDAGAAAGLIAVAVVVGLVVVGFVLGFAAKAVLG